MKLEINHTIIYNYVEFSFCLPIGDLFYEKWDEDSLKTDGKEIRSISTILNATFDKEEIETNYWDKTNNVEVYHSRDDKEVFIMFDLIRDLYDQCDMIYIGVRCNRRDDNIIRDVLLSLYKKSSPRSNFGIDYFNQSLYRRIFNSDFYFYKEERNKNRSIIHHNLE